MPHPFRELGNTHGSAFHYNPALATKDSQPNVASAVRTGTFDRATFQPIPSAGKSIFPAHYNELQQNGFLDARA